MIREFAVKAETHEGKTLTLRRGFESEEAAEAHPITLSLWKQVWVEEVQPRAADIDKNPPFPWTVQWVGGYAYVIDADGRKIASLLGSQARREYVASIVCDLK